MKETYGWRQFTTRRVAELNYPLSRGCGGWLRGDSRQQGAGQAGWFSQRPVEAGAVGSAVAAGNRLLESEEPGDKRQRVEAILLLSRGPLTNRKLAQLAGLADATEARTLVRQLNQRYNEENRAFRVEEVAGGYQFMTRPALAPWLRRLGHIPKTIQLTPPAMETIAIVAYRQPVLRADIEAIRGVSCGEILRQLMDRDLVRISGRSEELGRPYLYSTTKLFLQTFGLRGADALPALDESEIEISDDPDWSDDSLSTDPSPDQQPVSGAPEEESDVSTLVAPLVIEHAAGGGEFEPTATLAPEMDAAAPQSAIEDEEDEIYLDDDDEDDDDDDDFDDDDWADDDDEDDEDLDDDDDEEDADWEEVDDDWDEEAEDEEDLDEDLEEDDWDDEEDDLGDDDDEEEEDDEEWD